MELIILMKFLPCKTFNLKRSFFYSDVGTFTEVAGKSTPTTTTQDYLWSEK